MRPIVDLLLEVSKRVLAGYDYNPEDSDLDDVQPIHVSMTLGDYRRLKSLVYRVEKELQARVRE